MSDLSVELAQVAEELITEFGEAVTFSTHDSGDYDPSIGEGSADLSTSYVGYAVPFEYSAREIDGTTVLRGDKYVLCHQMSNVPAVDDTITIAGTSYRIIRVSNTRLNGDDIIYKLQVRI